MLVAALGTAIVCVWQNEFAKNPHSDTCLSSGPHLGPSVRLRAQARRWWKDTGWLSEGGCGAGLRPTMEQRRASWSHWPNFRISNTTLDVCEKKGVHGCVSVVLCPLTGHKTWPGIVSGSLFSLVYRVCIQIRVVNKVCPYALLYPYSP